MSKKPSAPQSQEPRAAAVRHWDVAKAMYIVTNPRDALYSNMLFLSTDYWDGSAWCSVKETEE